MITRFPALSLHDDPAFLSDHPDFKARFYRASPEELVFPPSVVAMFLHLVGMEWSGWVEVIILALTAGCQASSASTSTSRSAGFTYSNTSKPSSTLSSNLKEIGQATSSFISRSSSIPVSIDISQSTSRSISSFSSNSRSASTGASIESPASLAHSSNTSQSIPNPSPLNSSHGTTTRTSVSSLNVPSSQSNKNTSSSVAGPSMKKSLTTGYQNQTLSRNSSTSTTAPRKPLTALSNSLLTSCNGQTHLSMWDYLNPFMKTLDSASFTQVWGHQQSIILSIEGELAILTAKDPTYTNTYYAEAYSSLDVAISVLWESPLDAYDTFQSMAARDGCKFLECRAQFLSQRSTFKSIYPGEIFKYRAQPPCCGGCMIFADKVEVSYWPTPAPTPLVTRLWNSLYGEMTSPSVYVSVQNIAAWNWCSAIGRAWDVWGVLDPREISTYYLPKGDITTSYASYTMANFADYGKPQCTCTANCSVDAAGITHSDLCTPQLSMPATILSYLQGAWGKSICTADWFGVFDPPSALIQKTVLTPAKTTPANSVATIPGPTLPPTAAPVDLPPSPTISSTSDLGITRTAKVGGDLQGPSSSDLPGSATAAISFSIPPQYTQSKYGFPPEVLSAAGSVQPSAEKVLTDGSPAGITTAPAFLLVDGKTVTANSQGSYIVGTQTYTADAQGNIVIGTQTLSAGGSAITQSGTVVFIAGGPAITISGTVYSLPPSGTQVVVGGTKAAMTGTSLGAIIISMFGPEKTETSTTQIGLTETSPTETNPKKTTSSESGDNITTKTADSGLGAIIISFVKPGTTSTSVSSSISTSVSTSISGSVSILTKTVIQSAPTYVTKSAGRRGISIDAPGVAGMIALTAGLFVLMIWL